MATTGCFSVNSRNSLISSASNPVAAGTAGSVSDSDTASNADMSIWLQRGAIASITSFDERRLNVALGASSPVPISTTSLVASFSCSKISPGMAIFTAPGETSASSSRLSRRR